MGQKSEAVRSQLDIDISAVVVLALKKDSLQGHITRNDAHNLEKMALTSSCFSYAIGNCCCRGSWQLYFVSYPFCWITSTQPQLYLCKYVYIHLHTFESVYPICYS